MSRLTHRQLLETVADYVADRVTDNPLTGFGYKGVLPPLSNRSDFRNFPSGYYPFLGVAPLHIQYLDRSLGQYYPTIDLQIQYSSRTSGVSPDEDMPAMLDYTQELEDILKEAVRETRFGLGNYLSAVDMVDCMLYPTFYTEVDGNRKAFQIGVFIVRLYRGGL